MPHDPDTSLDSSSVRMHTALPSRRGCSQVLFLGILSPHVYSITLELQRGVGATCLADVRLASHKGSCSPPACVEVEYNNYIPCVQTPFLSALDGGFAWDQPAVYGVETPPAPRRERSHPCPTCFIRL